MNKTIYDPEYRTLMSWLRQQRKDKGLTLRDVGERLGVHHSRVGRIEQGERRLDVLEFAHICQEIGCDPIEGMRLIAPSAGKKRLIKAAESRAGYSYSRNKRRSAPSSSEP